MYNLFSISSKLYCWVVFTIYLDPILINHIHFVNCLPNQINDLFPQIETRKPDEQTQISTDRRQDGIEVKKPEGLFNRHLRSVVVNEGDRFRTLEEI